MSKKDRNYGKCRRYQSPIIGYWCIPGRCHTTRTKCEACTSPERMLTQQEIDNYPGGVLV